MATARQASLNVPARAKALFHNVTGAGRSKVIRKFLGLTSEEQTQIRATLERGIRDVLRRAR